MMLIYTRERCLGATTKHEKLPETLWRIPKVKDGANFYLPFLLLFNLNSLLIILIKIMRD